MAESWIKEESISPRPAKAVQGEEAEAGSDRGIDPTPVVPSSGSTNPNPNPTGTPTSATTAPPAFPPVLETQPSSSYSLDLSTFGSFNTIDNPYIESSSSNISPASSNPVTPVTSGDANIASSTASAATSSSGPAAASSDSVKTSSTGKAPVQFKPKRVRTSKPKVKTGCTNCKQRRVKCDEARPACTNCVRSNKVCTGYPPPSRSARPFEEVRIAPKPMPAGEAQATPSTAIVPLHSDFHLPPRRARQRTSLATLRTASPGTPSASPTTYQPSLGLQLPSNEGSYFEIFRSYTASELSGFFDNSFWTRRVLQECHAEDAIKCAVIALGALYQTLEQTVEPNAHARPGLSADARAEMVRSHWQVAIKRYSDACNALVKLNSQDQRSHKVLIMANVLLACFDSFIGDHRQAIHQIQTGLSLLNTFRAQQRERLLPAAEDPVEEELVTIFTRLAIQAKSYDMAFHFPQPFSIRLSSPPQPQSPGSSRPSSPPHEEPWTIPETFTSVLEARIACDMLNARIMRYIEGLFAIKTDLKGTLPQSWRDYGLQFRGQIETWCSAFDSIFQSRHSPSVSPQEKAGIAALKMLATNGQILYLMMFSDKESDFDAFLPQFRTMVELGFEIISDEERRAALRDCPSPEQCQHQQHQHWQSQDFFSSGGFSAPHIKPRFAADLGIVAPLFVVATKCRDPGTRRQAIQLLRSSARREGMWDSEMVAHISTWVMNLEESESLAMGVESFPSDGSARPIPRIVPEEKRVMIRSVDFDLRARAAELQVGTRGLQPGLPDPKFRQTRLTW
nr:zinc-cluster transcription factor [Fusarium keratoplasticum]